MNARSIRRLTTLALCLGLFALASQGANKPTCQPVEPGLPVCLTAVDCDGLVPDVNCVGGWACVDATCVWKCDGGCSENSDCVSSSAYGHYCAKASGDCKGTGSCEQQPSLCPAVYAPVCGCDGETYGNSCEAAAAGVNVASEGICAEPPLECEDNNDCEPDPLTDPAVFPMYCAKETGACESKGACEPVPQICPDVWYPVCGCDGETYGNSCEAAHSEMNIAAIGECEPPPGYCESNDACAAGQYCFRASCAQESGACVPRPEACAYLFAPVCGCDGETYSNSCVAAAAGANVDYDGECGPPPGLCWEDSMCATGEFCELAGCGAKSGDCAVIPTACYMIYAPVCGCDGVTYGNDCTAAAASMTIDHDGECKE